MTKTSSVARNAIHLVLGQVATTALAIVLSAALGRSLGAGDFGVYFLVFSMSTFAYVFVEWGQQLFVIREVARQPERAGELIGTSIALRVGGAAIVAVPTGVAAWVLGYDARTCWYAVLFIAASLPYFVAQAYAMAFRGRDRMELDALLSVTNKVLVLGLTLAALALGWGIPGVMLALGLAGVGALVQAARLYGRLELGPLLARRTTAREVLAGGAPILAMMAAISVQPYLDAVILSKLAPASAVGWFGAAKNIMGTLLAPAVILGSATYPRLSRAAHDLPLFKREMRAALRPLLFLGALAGVGTWLFADVAIGLIYGKAGFGPATTVLQVYGPALFLLFVDVLLGHVITATGRSGGFAIAKILSVALSTGLDFWLIPLFQERYGNGGIGVVVAFAASEVVVFAGSMMLLPRGGMEPAVLGDAARAVAAAAATAGIFHLLPGLHPVLGIPLCVVVYAAVAAAIGLLRRSDVEALRGALRKGR